MNRLTSSAFLALLSTATLTGLGCRPVIVQGGKAAAKGIAKALASHSAPVVDDAARHGFSAAGRATESWGRAAAHNTPHSWTSHSATGSDGTYRYATEADIRRILDGFRPARTQDAAHALGTSVESAQPAAFEVIAVVPDSATGFQGVFGKGAPYSFTASSEATAMRNGYRSAFSSARVLGDTTDDARKLFELFSEMTQDNIVLVGHSENGRLHLASGARPSFEEIHSAAERAGKTCIICTCYSPDLSLAFQITHRQAVSALSRATAALKDVPQPTPSTVASAIREQFLAIKRDHQVEVAVRVVGLGAGGAGVYGWYNSRPR